MMPGTDGLVKRFGALTVLDGITTEFRPSSVTAIVGPNGSGKSTFMKCALSLVTPTSGRVYGFDRERIGAMAQTGRYPDNLTPTDIFRLVRSVRRRPAPHLNELLDVFDLAPHVGKAMRTLSGGTRQKVGAVVALMDDVDILLLDEPTAGLDPVAASRLKDIVAARRNHGATVLVTSHILSDLQELADRLLFLLDGRIVHDGSIDAVLQTTQRSTLERAVADLMTRGPI